MLNEDPAVTLWRESLDIAIQQAAEKHLEACQDAMFYSEDPEGDREPPEDPSYAPFCGCTTCVVREVLMAAWMHIRWGKETPDPIREALQREWDR